LDLLPDSSALSLSDSLAVSDMFKIFKQKGLKCTSKAEENIL
jgi:hypothetical protein